MGEVHVFKNLVKLMMKCCGFVVLFRIIVQQRETLDRHRPRGKVESITRKGKDTQEHQRLNGPSWEQPQSTISVVL